jgi:hypothetical protein
MAFSGQLLFLGLFILLLGGGFWLGAILLSRRVFPRRRIAAPASTPTEASGTEARVVVTSGGQLIRADAMTQHWFSLPGTDLSLQSITSAAYPAGDIWKLVSREGRAVVRIRKQLYNVSSHLIGTDGRTEMEIRFRPLPGAAQLFPPAVSDAAPGFIRSAFSSLDLPKAAHNLLVNLVPLSGADWGMIAIWDPIRQMLIPRCSLASASLDPSIRLPQSILGKVPPACWPGSSVHCEFRN